MRSPMHKFTQNKISGETEWRTLITNKHTFPAQRILEASKVSASGLQSTITSFSYNTNNHKKVQSYTTKYIFPYLLMVWLWYNLHLYINDADDVKHDVIFVHLQNPIFKKTFKICQTHVLYQQIHSFHNILCKYLFYDT